MVLFFKFKGCGRVARAGQLESLVSVRFSLSLSLWQWANTDHPNAIIVGSDDGILRRGTRIFSRSGTLFHRMILMRYCSRHLSEICFQESIYARVYFVQSYQCVGI